VAVSFPSFPGSGSETGPTSDAGFSTDRLRGSIRRLRSLVGGNPSFANGLRLADYGLLAQLNAVRRGRGGASSDLTNQRVFAEAAAT